MTKGLRSNVIGSFINNTRYIYSYLMKQLFWPQIELIDKVREENNANISTNNIVLFVHYNKNNIIEDSDIEYVNELSKLGKVVFISNANVCDKEISKISKEAIEVMIRENRGFDFGAWKYFIDNNKKKISEYDNIILANNSVYAPIYNLCSIFNKMDSNNKTDFWGITAFTENDKRKSKESIILNIEKVPQHIQSYFIVFKKRMVNAAFYEFWKGLNYYPTFVETVKYCEAEMTEYFQKLGFCWDVYCSYTKKSNTYHVDGPDMSKYEPDILLMQGCPFIKKKSLGLISAKQYKNIRTILVSNKYKLTNQLDADRKRIKIRTANKVLDCIFERNVYE